MHLQTFLETREGLMNKNTFEPQKLTLNRLPLLVFVSILLLGLFACDKATGIQDTSGAETVEDLNQERQQNEEHVSTIESTPVSASGGFFGVPAGVYDGEESSSDDYYYDDFNSYEGYYVVASNGDFMFFDIGTSMNSGERCLVGVQVYHFEAVDSETMQISGYSHGEIDQTGFNSCSISDQDIYDLQLEYISLAEMIEYESQWSEEGVTAESFQFSTPIVTDSGFQMDDVDGDADFFYATSDYPEFLDYYIQ